MKLFCLTALFATAQLSFYLDPAIADNLTLNKSLYDASTFQNLPQIKELISKGANVNHVENGRPILGWVAQGGNPAVVELLLSNKANPNITDKDNGHSPLMRAIDMQNLDIVNLLLKYKANPSYVNSSDRSCLYMAIESNKPEIVRSLIKAGADVKFKTKDNNSLVLAAAQGISETGIEIISMLKDAGAPMDISNAAYTPLLYAIQQENVSLVKALLDAGANPNAKSESGQLPIMSALNNSEILEMLIKAKANVNVEDDYKSTPLLSAMQNSNAIAVKLLVDAGADLTKKDYSGATPLEIAERDGHSEIADIIKAKLPSSKEELKTYPADSNVGTPGAPCTIVDAARRNMDLHGKLQAQVNAGKMSDQIFRTYMEDTKELSTMLVEDPAAACRLFDKLGKKYGVE